jgi:hypothetical protein
MIIFSQFAELSSTCYCCLVNYYKVEHRTVISNIIAHSVLTADSFKEKCIVFLGNARI